MSLPGLDGSVGLHITIKQLLDWLSIFPSWRRSLQGTKKRLGLVVSTDGASLGSQGGVVSTVAWLVNSPETQQSARQVFTLALSNGSDSVSETQIHHGGRV